MTPRRSVRSALPLALAAALLAGAATTACREGESTVQVKPDQRQIAEAVLAAPESMRQGAGVLGYGSEGRVTTLRQGSNQLLCLADDPSADGFQVSCYHRDLEPFMARGRELRRQGMEGEAVDSVRFAEIESGDLSYPDHPAALYTLAGPTAPEDPSEGEPPAESQRLTVLYVRGATAEQLGLPAKPSGGIPWLMAQGQPDAHVMISSP